MCLNEGPGDGAIMLGYLDGLNINTRVLVRKSGRIRKVMMEAQVGGCGAISQGNRQPLGAGKARKPSPPGPPEGTRPSQATLDF